MMLSKALASDPFIDRTRYASGQRDYMERGMQLTHGPAGWGYYGLPLPWGVSADIDLFLQAQGHVRG